MSVVPEARIGSAAAGTRLGGRYRLDDRVSAGPGWSAWKATDEMLARPVTVLALAPGFPRTADALTAARSAARLTDARLARVFDVDTSQDHAYVVTEWAAGETLDDLLAEGPLDPGRGAEIIAQGAQALAVAHAAGVTHLCLTPRSLLWTAAGGVKIVGLGIDAAVAGVTAADHAVADTQGLARLLYAALTASWPAGGWPSLPAAPEVHGHPRRPRQVRAGVPAGLDAVACQALFQNGGQPVATPAMLATALSRVTPAPAPPPRPVTNHRAAAARPERQARGPAHQHQRTDRIAARSPRAPDTVLGRRPVTARVMASVGVVLAGVAMGVGVWSVGHHGSISQTGDTPQLRAAPPAVPVTVLKPAGAHGYDPLSSVADDPGNENSGQAQFATDGDPATAWHTQYYLNNPRFGGLKSGTGLILDMGQAVRLSSVTVSFGPVPGASAEIKVGSSDLRSPAALRMFTTVSSRAGVGGTVTFREHSAVTGRYVLIWFTQLPPQTAGSTGSYEAEIFNVTVRGVVSPHSG
jgi:serine/threonine protein kinase